MIDFRTISVLPFRRADFLEAAVRQAMPPVPYVWGGDDPKFGLDCSGYIAAIIWRLSKGALDIRVTHNTTAMWREFDQVHNSQLLPADLGFYGPTADRPVSHVMVYLGEGVVIGQAYGDSTCKDPIASLASGKVTKCLPVDYRRDLVGFRRLRFANPKEIF